MGDNKAHYDYRVQAAERHFNDFDAAVAAVNIMQRAGVHRVQLQLTDFALTPQDGLTIDGMDADEWLDAMTEQ